MTKIIPFSVAFVALFSTAAAAQPADAGQGGAGKGRVTAQTRFATDIPALSATASPGDKPSRCRAETTTWRRW
jgi:hypothetical protein